ncbi:autotransporter outer membrane beta-barrel domain-containing protein [uncultured Helicobacter sp.]|uniref:autotransporter outer membrane beta-barrel domain-containing protein n=1 Tax=uncultured Helicobacter sp. TaxID=175537 RepID=UPI0026127A13|nr:autotransporter outer membrane beta-barrel domain-containing protein [uncultured Helicobacter sp.]
MKKSYIALSLILSQALCADAADIKTDLIADFYSNGTKGSLNVTKPKQAQSVQATSLVTTDEVATYGTDWYGSTSYLDVKTDDLTFSFNDGSRQATNLVFSDGLTIRNNDANSKSQAKITITSDGAKLKTLSIGQTANPSNRVTLGSDVNLMIKNFNDVKIVSNLYVGANSVFDVSDSSINNFTNDGGIVLEGKDSTLKVKDTLTNNGTIMMREGSKIESVQNLSIGSNPPATKQGSIIVQGNSEINSGANNLTITNQNITIQNTVSKTNNEVNVSKPTLTLSSTNTSGTLTLGDSSNGVVNISGEIGNKDPSNITTSDIPSGSEIGNVSVSGFTTLDLKNVNFKNINLKSEGVTTLNLKAGVLGLENTSITLAPSASITADTTTSTITLTGQNAISTTGELTVKGTHTFAGSGTLDFVGSTIKLGNNGTPNANFVGSSGSEAKIGFKATTIETNKLNLKDISMQVFSGSEVKNTQIVLNNAGIYGINSDGSAGDLLISKNGSGTSNIIVKGGTSGTIGGKSVTLNGTAITLKNTAIPTTLTLQADDKVVFGKERVSIEGKNTTSSQNILNLYAPLIQVQAQTDLKQVSIHTQDNIIFEIQNGNTLKFVEGSEVDTSTTEKSKSLYHSLTFASQSPQASSSYSLEFTKDTNLKASAFSFQNQTVALHNSGSGVKLNLYSYGSTLVDNSGTPSTSGSFYFSNTTFSNGSTSSLNLYSGEGGANLMANDLTLVSVNLNSYKISNGTLSTSATKNSLNLGTIGNSLTALGSVTIEASKIGVGTNQSIGMNLNVGNSNKYGKLTIKSDTDTGSFVLDGTLTIDNSRASGADSSFDIQLGTTTHKLSEQTLSLQINGGLTTLGEASKQSTTEIKAKSFTFGEDSIITSKNGIMRLKIKNNGNEVTLGKLLDLQGIDSSSVTTKFLVANDEGSYGVTLKLHDIQATGKASIDGNGLSFIDSNITVSDSGTHGGMTFQDRNTTTDNLIAGTIDSITLNDGNLEFKNKSDSDASITLNADSVITSSGTSSLTLKTIKVGSNDKGLYSLNVIDGTFTLKESTVGTQLGAITLGSEDSSISGAGASFAYMNGTPSSYNTLTLKGDLTSYGTSSIIANSFVINAKDGDENYAITSTGGTLTLQAQTTSTPLTLTADLTLKDGGLKYVDSVGQNAELKFGSKSTISSSGDSSIEAKNLDLNGVDVSASEGTLTLKGISSSTKAGSVSVGNAGVLRLEASNSKLATLRVNGTINLSASVPYITPNEPLGNGVFGQVVAESVQFESQDKSPLITLSLSEASSTSAMSDSLFALREGGIMLIDTNSGIKKKTSTAEYGNITLEDVSSDLGEFTSISLQPYLKYGKDTQGKDIVEDLMLNLRVTQTNVDQLVESIKDSSKKEQMQSLLSSGSNALVIESIMNGDDNPLKTGMALYISSGNVDVVSNALEYITGAFVGLNDSLYASHKIAQELKMIKTVNVENRMVRGKNPYLSKLEVAQLVRKAVGVRYASSDDEILLEDEESGVKDGELWVSFDGAMSFSESMGNASVYGFSGGYDTLLGEQKNYLLGFYFGYGYGSYSANFATNNSHNVSLGFYSRMSFENNEVDLILSQSIGLNTTRIDYGATDSVVAQMLKQDISYNFYTTDIEARYGYVFSVGDKENPYYFRPFGGINFAMIVNSEGRGDGEAPIGMDSLITYQLGVSAGVEMRKYFGENYLYLLPVLEKGLLNDGSGTKIGFVGSQSISYNLPYTIDTGISMYLGGQGNVGDNVAISGAVGVKVGLESKEILTNWNVGVRYKF